MWRVKSKTTSILWRFVFGVRSFRDCIRGFFHPGDSHFRGSELFTTTMQSRPVSTCHVSVAELLVWPVIVRVVQRCAFLERTTKLLPELTCKPDAEYLLFVIIFIPITFSSFVLKFHNFSLFLKCLNMARFYLRSKVSRNIDLTIAQ